MQCAVSARSLAWSLRLFLELIAEHPRTQHIYLAKMHRRILFLWQLSSLHFAVPRFFAKLSISCGSLELMSVC